MSELSHLERQGERTFKLVCANFAMLFILFAGLFFIVWQALSLVSTLKADLARAEESVAQLRERMETMDAEVVIDRAVGIAVASMKEELAAAIPNGDTLKALAGVPEQLEATSEALQAISEKVQDLDAEKIAQQVSYELLKGLGDGFNEAAETRKP
jgi:hypothetical protein